MNSKVIKAKSIKKESRLYENAILVLFNLLIQTGVFFACCILALIADVKSNYYTAIAIFAFVSGGAFSGFMTGVKTGKKGLLNGVIYSLPSLFIYIIISLFVNSFIVDYIFAVSVLLYIAAAAAGGVTAVNMRIKPKIKRHKRRK